MRHLSTWQAGWWFLLLPVSPPEPAPRGSASWLPPSGSASWKVAKIPIHETEWFGELLPETRRLWMGPFVASPTQTLVFWLAPSTMVLPEKRPAFLFLVLLQETSLPPHPWYSAGFPLCSDRFPSMLILSACPILRAICFGIIWASLLLACVESPSWPPCQLHRVHTCSLRLWKENSFYLVTSLLLLEPSSRALTNLRNHV